MANQALQADTDNLRHLATLLDQRADGMTVGMGELPAADEGAAEAMPDTAFAAALDRATGPVARAYQAMSGRVHGMATAANTNATDYDALDAALAAQLRAYRNGQ